MKTPLPPGSASDTKPLTLGPESSRLRPEACLFLVAQGERPLAPSARILLGAVDEIFVGRGESTSVAPRTGQSRHVEIAVPDSRMSARHAQFSSIGHRWHLEDRQSRNGTYVNGARVERATLSDGDVIDAGHTIFLYREHAVDDEPPVFVAAEPLRGLVSLVPAVQRELDELGNLATSAITLLIEGETGTGKEVVASALHRLSGRTGELVPVNCGGLPRERVAAELFGWKRGAFSGAAEDYAGLVRASHKGTLLLDEIGDLPSADQAALLRVLQEREVLPIGMSKPIRVDLRVIAATHQPLDALVARNQFRADLLARLSGYRATLAPLRDRREDLGIVLADILRERHADLAGRVSIHIDALRALLAHTWPANIRELEQAIGQAIARRDFNGVVRAAQLPRLRTGDTPPTPTPTPPGGTAPARRRSDDQRRAELVSLLREHRGNIAEVARQMGKARMQIQRWLRYYGIDVEDFRK